MTTHVASQPDPSTTTTTTPVTTTTARPTTTTRPPTTTARPATTTAPTTSQATTTTEAPTTTTEEDSGSFISSPAGIALIVILIAAVIAALVALLVRNRKQTTTGRLAADIDQLVAEGDQVVATMNRPVSTPTATAVRDSELNRGASALLTRIQGVQRTASQVDNRALTILRDMAEQVRRVAEEAGRSEAAHTAATTSAPSLEYAEATLRQSVDQLAAVLARARAWLRSVASR